MPALTLLHALPNAGDTMCIKKYSVSPEYKYSYIYIYDREYLVN